MSEHVEVLKVMRDELPLADRESAALDAAIAALSAPAEAQPVGVEGLLRDGERLLASLPKGWVILIDRLNYLIARDPGSRDVFKSLRGNDGAEFLEVVAAAFSAHAHQPPSAPVGVEELMQRIDAAIERVTTDRAAMRIPADLTDPDLVLADARNWIKQAALAQHPPAAPVGVELDAAALGRFAQDEWMTSHEGYPSWGRLVEAEQAAWLAVGERIKRAITLAQQPAAEYTDADALIAHLDSLCDEIDAAIERVTSGRGDMRIPADPTDPDLVLADAGDWIERAALAGQQGGEA